MHLERFMCVVVVVVVCGHALQTDYMHYSGTHTRSALSSRKCKH